MYVIKAKDSTRLLESFDLITVLPIAADVYPKAIASVAIITVCRREISSSQSASPSTTTDQS